MASAAGAARNPAWYYNLAAHPGQVEIEVEGRAIPVTAEQLHVPLVTSLMPAESFASGDKTGWAYSWDLFYDEQQQAADAAKALTAAPGDKKVALFTDDDPDSVVERPLYQAAFAAAGLRVVGDYTFPAGTKDLAPSRRSARVTVSSVSVGAAEIVPGAARRALALARTLGAAEAVPDVGVLGGEPQGLPLPTAADQYRDLSQRRRNQLGQPVLDALERIDEYIMP